MEYLKLLRRYRFSGLLLLGRLNFIRRSFSQSYFEDDVNISFEDIQSFSVGNNCYIGKFSTLVVANDSLNSLKNSYLKIGNGTYIGEYNNIRAGGGSITIGSNCLISQHISIIASNHSFWKDGLIRFQPWSIKNNFVEIGDDVWIGCNSIILPGARIGNGAVISAGSIVNFEVPNFAIVKGNPSKIVSYRKSKYEYSSLQR